MRSFVDVSEEAHDTDFIIERFIQTTKISTVRIPFSAGSGTTQKSIHVQASPRRVYMDHLGHIVLTHVWCSSPQSTSRRTCEVPVLLDSDIRSSDSYTSTLAALHLISCIGATSVDVVIFSATAPNHHWSLIYLSCRLARICSQMTEPKKRKAINRTKGAGKVTKRPRAVRNVTLQSGNEPLHAAQATDASPLLVLRIAYASLGAESTTSDTVGRDMIPSATLYLDVLSGRVEDLDLYAATCGGASWLQVVAHNIFDPLGQRGELWTHAEGTSTDWCARLRNDTEWSAVTAGAGLKPSVYEYVMPAGVEVYMPKVCVRKSSSATSKNSESREQAARFREAVAQRDSCCIVTQISEDELPLKATRIIPRRLQSQVSAITQRYVHTSEKGIVDRYDSRIGCLLNSCVNTLFGSFTAGLFRDPVSDSLLL
jgi:hypothetical protein